MPFLFKAMTARFYHWGEKLSAFTSDNRLVMSFGSPIASVPITVKELQDFVCTLEQAIDDEPNVKQRLALGSIKHIFQASLKQAQKDHEQIVEETPTGADLEEYMLSYARAVKTGAF
jgi:aminopeptidase-like protein